MESYNICIVASVLRVAQMVKNLPAMQEIRVGTIPWRRAWQPTPVFLPGNPHGQKSQRGCKDVTNTHRQGSDRKLSPSFLGLNLPLAHKEPMSQSGTFVKTYSHPSHFSSSKSSSDLETLKIFIFQETKAHTERTCPMCPFTTCSHHSIPPWN